MNLTPSLLADMARAAHRSPEGARALLLVLVESETVPADWLHEAYLESGSLEHECADYFHAGGIARVWFDGTINLYPN